ncbi:MAG TPA: LPS export ABC transporter permease LptG [Nitrospirae bacterium]|nr:LPS export ABC transporter permease LptG [Nitrospirota bacterium]
MRTFDKYILTEFFRIFMLSLIVMVSFYEMVTFIDMSGYFFKFKATFDMMSRYMIFKMPMALFHVTPICVLLASVLTISDMSRNSELIAMKSVGMSMARIALPIIVAAGGISFVSFIDSEYLFTIAAKETNRIYYEEIKHQKRKGLFSQDKFWYMADDGSIWNIGLMDIKNKTIKDVGVFRFDKSGSKIVKRVTADSGKLVDGSWILENYVERDFTSGGQFTERVWPRRSLPEDSIKFDDLNKVKLNPEEMNLAQIQKYIENIKSKGYDATRYVAEMHAKIGFPLITLVMPLLAIPLGARSSRSGGILIGIGVSVVIGVTFWFTFSMGLAFGKAGRLPPYLSVYGAHVLFAMTGLYMLFTDRQ